MNACKSGIYAQSEIIPDEDPAELEALKTRIYDSLQPSPEEGPLVDQLIGADWQFRRLRRAEADLWKESITGDMEANRKKGLPEHQYVYLCAIRDNKDTFERIYRFQASTARILDRSLDTLLRLRKLDLLQPPNQNEAQNEPDLPSARPEPVALALSAAAETNPISEAPVLSPPAPLDSDETNPIQPDSEPNPTPPQNDETNPIRPPAPIPQNHDGLPAEKCPPLRFNPKTRRFEHASEVYQP